MALLLSVAAVSADPLVGKWMRNLERSHYGGGAEPRRHETFTCQADGELLKCTIVHVRKVCEPLFMLFDFKEFSEDVYQDIIRRFEAGYVT